MNYDVALAKVVDDRSFHPIRQYLDGLPKWDKQKRVDTLLTDYLGAEDNPYTRAVIRKNTMRSGSKSNGAGNKV